MHKFNTTTPITNHESISSELRRIRRERKLSQELVAKQAMISRRTLINAESGGNIGLKELCNIINSLGYELTLKRKNSIPFEELSSYFKDDD